MRLTFIIFSLLEGIPPTKPFKKKINKSPVFAIQIVIKPGKINTLEALILSQSETELLIFK